MNQQQIDNIKIITDSLNKFGITNKNIQAGILSTVYKESNFIPQSENLNYSYDNIKRVWPNTPDDIAKSMAKNPEKLGNYRYSSKFFPSGGNGNNEGYKYRGRGFNQITFKNTYDRIGKLIGKDLVSNPDLLNDPKVAADALAVFYKGELSAGEKAGSFKKFGVDTISSVNDTITGTKVAIQINAGRGTSFNNGIVQEGYNKAIKIVDSLYEMIKGASSTTVQEVKKKPIITALLITVLVVSIYLIVKQVKKQ